MPDEELTGIRKLYYSGWHRPFSMKRFLGEEMAKLLKMIDVDVLEYSSYDYAPLALMETVEQGAYNRYGKNTRATCELAKRADIPAFLTCYNVDRGLNDIWQFQIKQVWPKKDSQFRILSPQQYAEFLRDLHLSDPNLKRVIGK